MTTSTPDQKHSKKKKKNGKKEKKPQLKSRLRKRKNSSDDGDEENSDVDERGNIKGLIDYDYEDDVYERDVCSDDEEKKSSKTGSKAKTRGKTKGKRGSSLKKCRRSARLAKQSLQSQVHSRAKPNKRRQTLTMVPEYEIFVENDGIIQPHPHYMQMNPPQFQPQIQPAQDDMLTKMMVLSQLCAQVEKMDKRRARKKKKRVKSVESSTEEETSSDEEFDIDEAEEDEEDLRETFTPAEQKYYKSLSKKKRRNAVEEYDILREYHKTEIPLKFKILSLKNTTDQSKCFLLNRLATFQSMEPHENEFHKLNAWFTQFEKLPLTNYVQFPIQKKKQFTQRNLRILAGKPKNDGFCRVWPRTRKRRNYPTYFWMDFERIGHRSSFGSPRATRKRKDYSCKKWTK